MHPSTAGISDVEPILPAAPCSRNLRRRTGVWLGVEAWELVVILCLSTLPDVMYRVGILARSNLFLGLGISAAALAFVILFKRNKPPGYFSLWLHHHVIHPPGWRAPSSSPRLWPVLEDSVNPLPNP